MEAAWSKFDAWQESQVGQTDGYEYEKTFDEMIVGLGNSLLQKSVGDLPKTPMKKKIKTHYEQIEVRDDRPLAVGSGGFGISPYLQELL